MCDEDNLLVEYCVSCVRFCVVSVSFEPEPIGSHKNDACSRVERVYEYVDLDLVRSTPR